MEMVPALVIGILCWLVLEELGFIILVVLVVIAWNNDDTVAVPVQPAQTYEHQIVPASQTREDDPICASSEVLMANENDVRYCILGGTSY